MMKVLSVKQDNNYECLEQQLNTSHTVVRNKKYGRGPTDIT